MNVKPTPGTMGFAGPGLTIARLCAGCGSRTTQSGGGLRLVLGLRTWVCAGCKHTIDMARARANNPPAEQLKGKK